MKLFIMQGFLPTKSIRMLKLMNIMFIFEGNIYTKGTFFTLLFFKSGTNIGHLIIGLCSKDTVRASASISGDGKADTHGH